MASGDTSSGESVRRRWLAGFADGSGAAFRSQAARDVTLAGSVFVRPITGTHAVWTALRAAAGIYDTIAFTHATTEGRRTYLEWDASALGLTMAGVTVLAVDADDLFDTVAIHHRPLSAALLFSMELRRRLVATLDPTFFYRSGSDG